MGTSITSVTDGQKKQIRRFAEDAVDRAMSENFLNKDSAQMLIVNGDEFQAHIITGIKELSVSNQFANEEVNSSYKYPEGYKGPKPIEEQIKAIAKIFDLDPSQALEYAKNLPQFPNGAEGWFAIPSVDALAAKHFPEVTDPTEKYCRAVQLVHAKIAEFRAFYNYREGQITSDHLRMHAHTARALEQIAETQKGDILIIAAQLGMRHGNPIARSVRRAREVFISNEFGLGSVAGGSILLTHPEKEVCWEQLHMDLPGDEFAPGADGDVSCAPCFGFSCGEVKFGADGVGYAYQYYGSASGFLPQ